MARLVGEDGNTGMLSKLETHMENMQKRAAGIEKKLTYFSLAMLFGVIGNGLRNETVLVILKSLAGIK